MKPLKNMTHDHAQNYLSLLQSIKADLTLISKEGVAVRTWKLILCFHSPSLAMLLAQTNEGGQDGQAAISVPFGREVLKEFVDRLEKGDELEENEATLFFGIQFSEGSTLLKEESGEKEFLEIRDTSIVEDDQPHSIVAENLPTIESNNEILKIKTKYKKKAKNRKLNNYNCHLCNHMNGFIRESLLHKHILVKHRQPVVCSLCQVSFDSSDSFLNHMKDKLHSGLTCETCGDTFKSSATLRKHITWIHEDREKLPCSFCGIIVKNMDLHVKNIHENPIETCKFCDFETRRTYSMEKHVQSVHTDKNLKTCEFCGELRKDLRNHLMRTQCGQGKSVEERKCETCDQCGKLFTTKVKLKMHKKRVHLKIKTMSCDQCDYKTYSGFNLKLHVSKMHFGQKLEKEKCGYCSIVINNLPYHVKIYHQGNK